jgi:hypothetical protein
MFAASSQGTRHRYASTAIRLTAGSWNLALGLFLLTHGQRWAVVLLAVAAVIFWAAYTRAPGKRG